MWVERRSGSSSAPFLRSVSTLLLLFSPVFASAAEPASSIHGAVLDPARRPIAGAVVRVEGAGGSSAAATTDSLGNFSLAIPENAPSPASLRVEAKGYLSRVVRLPEDTSAPVEVTLSVAGFTEKVAVVGARRPERLSETPSSVVSMGSEDLARVSVPALDEALREVPGFTLFRRNDSRTANPTTQGASLRGIGGSGASRAAVLDD